MLSLSKMLFSFDIWDSGEDFVIRKFKEKIEEFDLFLRFLIIEIRSLI